MQSRFSAFSHLEAGELSLSFFSEAQASPTTHRRWKQENREFKAILSYTGFEGKRCH
ncbi:hypothetical protein LEMLEM_LOCUS12115, partial [Lemmus lemmus]